MRNKTWMYKKGKLFLLLYIDENQLTQGPHAVTYKAFQLFSFRIGLQKEMNTQILMDVFPKLQA